MPNRLHLEVDGPAPCPVAVVINGALQSDVTEVGFVASANPPGQLISIERVAPVDGRLFYSRQTHNITKATLIIEYEEAVVVQQH